MEKQPPLSWLEETEHNNFKFFLKSRKYSYKSICAEAKLKLLADNTAAVAGQWAHIGFEYVIRSCVLKELHSHVFHEAECNMMQNGIKRHYRPEISAIIEGDLKDMFEKNLESVLSKELTIRGFRGAFNLKHCGKCSADLSQAEPKFINLDDSNKWNTKFKKYLIDSIP